MKTKIIFLFYILLLLTGCELVTNPSVDKTLSTVLGKKSSLSNQVFEGYKYYLPRGMKLGSKSDYNMTLKDGKGNTYYLYIDVISYYHKEDILFEQNKEAYYSSSLEYQNKKGYLEITQIGENGYYFIEEMFNYAKLEAYVKKEDLEDAIAMMSTILNSVQYNHKVLATLVGNNILHYQEETFTILKPKGDEVTDYENYLQYDQYIDKDNELPEEDQIEIKEE